MDGQEFKSFLFTRSISLKILLIFLLFFTQRKASPQEHSLEASFGYGGTAFIDEGGAIQGLLFSRIWPFIGKEHYSGSVRYCFKFPKIPIRIGTGIKYHERQASKLSTSALRIPFGIEFPFGNELRIIPGIGFYYDHIFNVHPMKEDIENIRLKNHGLQVKLGSAYRISELYALGFSYIHCWDLQSSYTKKTYSPGGASYTIKGIGLDGGFELKFRYFLTRETSDQEKKEAKPPEKGEP